MNFTERQMTILFELWTLHARGAGAVLEDSMLGEAEELAAAGWISKHTEPNGDTSWRWTGEAEAAIDALDLIESARVRTN